MASLHITLWLNGVAFRLSKLSWMGLWLVWYHLRKWWPAHRKINPCSVPFVPFCPVPLRSTQTKSNQILTEFTVDLRGASIAWAGKEKSSKKNVLEVWPQQASYLPISTAVPNANANANGCLCPVAHAKPHFCLCLSSAVAEESQRLGILDPVRHREHHQRLAQSHQWHHPPAGEFLW